ncbi:MAG: hypothetical protein OXU20_07000 [Myxococcales bacterium]|nr:hypothetical protein [Myxococcales bacterium]MDD9965630.1 hypothetical protein [Myxococcales bacterium]
MTESPYRVISVRPMPCQADAWVRASRGRFTAWARGVLDLAASYEQEETLQAPKRRPRLTGKTPHGHRRKTYVQFNVRLRVERLKAYDTASRMAGMRRQNWILVHLNAAAGLSALEEQLARVRTGVHETLPEGNMK